MYRQKVYVAKSSKTGLFVFDNRLEREKNVIKEPFGTPGLELDEI